MLNDGSNPDIVTTNQGNVLVAKATETFLHDLDGNLTSDSLWTNLWNGENRLIATESASGVPSNGKAKETWTYLPDGRWIERVIYTWNGSAYVAQSTNRFVWDGQVLLAIVDHTNGLVTSFARGLDLGGSKRCQSRLLENCAVLRSEAKPLANCLRGQLFSTKAGTDTFSEMVPEPFTPSVRLAIHTLNECGSRRSASRRDMV